MRFFTFGRIFALRIDRPLISIGTLAIVAACSSSGVTLSRNTPVQTPFTGFSAASNALCVTPSAAAQNVKLPTTGGVSATLALGAFPATATGCFAVKIATGSAVEIPLAAARHFQIDASSPMQPAPILTISVGEGLDGNPVFGYVAVVTGMQLNVSPLLNFPDGTYYATVTSSTGQLDGVIVFTAKNGVLTVATVQIQNEKNLPVVLVANTSSIIALYGRGVVPPTPAPSPSASASSSPSPSPSPSASATASPNPGPTTYGSPPPPPGTIIGTFSYNWPMSQGCTGNSPCSATNVPVALGPFNTGIPIPNGMSGTVSWTLPGIAYMMFYAPVVNTCPADWSISTDPATASAMITIPVTDYFEKPGQGPCTFTYSTLPPGVIGNYYYVTVQLT